MNGNVEENNFNNWSLSSGPRGNPSVSLANQVNGFNTNVHEITNVGFDPIVGGSLLSKVGEGLHSIKIGNSIATDTKADRASYTFTVTPSNADFGFKYAMVLQDGDHPLNENPFFSWMIIKGNNPNNLWSGGSSNVITGNQIIADKTSPFFKQGQNGTLYRDWSFICYDLTQYIGQQVTISFIATDCVFGGHFGYAYIDALCSPNNPTSAFNIKTRFCISEPITMDGTASTNEDSYFISVQESDQWWSPTGPEYTKWFVAQQAGIIDLKAFLQSLGGQFRCNKFYRIKLAVTNNCEQWVDITKLIQIVCPPIIDIPDITKCCVTAGQLVNLGPVAPNFGTTSIVWSIVSGNGTFAPNPLPNSNSAVINVLGNTTVQYTVTSNVYNGPKPNPFTLCSATESVNIRVIDDFSVNIIEETVDCCGSKLKVNITFTDGCNKWSNYTSAQQQEFLNSLNIVWNNGQTGSEINVTGPSQTYTATVSLAGCFSHSASYNYVQSALYSTSTAYTETVSMNNALISGDPTPNGRINLIGSYIDGTGQLYFPPYGTTQGIYKAKEFKIEVYNRWGNLFKTVLFQDCGSLFQGGVYWDGTDNSGNLVQSDVYVLKLYVKKCGSDGFIPICNAQNPFPVGQGDCLKICYRHHFLAFHWGAYCCGGNSPIECAYAVTVVN